MIYKNRKHFKIGWVSLWTSSTDFCLKDIIHVRLEVGVHIEKSKKETESPLYSQLLLEITPRTNSFLYFFGTIEIPSPCTCGGTHTHPNVHLCTQNQGGLLFCVLFGNFSFNDYERSFGFQLVLSEPLLGAGTALSLVHLNLVKPLYYYTHHRHHHLPFNLWGNWAQRSLATCPRSLSL